MSIHNVHELDIALKSAFCLTVLVYAHHSHQQIVQILKSAVFSTYMTFNPDKFNKLVNTMEHLAAKGPDIPLSKHLTVYGPCINVLITHTNERKYV